MISRVLNTLAAAAALTLAGGLAATPAHASKEAPVIGFSIDDLRVERWTHDRDYFVDAAKKLGATVNVQSANANEAKQIAQIENLIAQNVDVLVIVPFNSKVLGNAIASARKKGIKVVSYDRLILNADIDGYVSFDNQKVGEMQAQGVVRLAPKGNYFLLGGASTDNNARLLRDGQVKVLKPLVDKGDIKIVGQQWTPEWDPSKAQSIVENALTANGNNIQGIVASNDGTAGGAIQALAGQKLAGKVPVSGQDADLAGVRRVAGGTQAMTVYKPIKQIAGTAAEMAVELVKGTAPKFNTKLNNGKKDVDTILLTPTLLTKDNLDVVIKDGFYTHQQIYGK
ncbi:D-xylose ABC transporter substrate-binding protein [Ralstonia syzygii]|uniref:D-xylose ABC transporter substrate-binding protein n=1 Tax=Ralstonia syzygii TaxID=28097 RepID=UPI0018D18BD7|nr:D-xylose ABC transporter substrate-binding protein [Ralstonia syzygii]